MLHGWMDVSASFQFVVDASPADWRVVAPDWRGYGLTERARADCYWFPDYLADLERVLDAQVPDPSSWSATAWAATLLCSTPGYGRIARGPSSTWKASDCAKPTRRRPPAAYAQWLDELRNGVAMRDYDERGRRRAPPAAEQPAADA